MMQPGKQVSTKIDAAVAAKTNRGGPLAKPLPVHLVYDTAWVDEAGALRFSPDVYEFDGPQRAALDRVASRVLGGPASGAKEATRPPAL